MSHETTPEANRVAKHRSISSGGAYENVFGYSRAVVAGSHIHVSGTCAPATHEKSDAYLQARAALEIILNALSEAGSSKYDVVRTVVYLTDIADADAVAQAHLEIFSDVRPASTLIQVTSMIRDWQKVEIEAYAIK